MPVKSENRTITGRVCAPKLATGSAARRLRRREAALEQDAFGVNRAGVVLTKCRVQRIDEVLRRLFDGHDGDGTLCERAPTATSAANRKRPSIAKLSMWPISLLLNRITTVGADWSAAERAVVTRMNSDKSGAAAKRPTGNASLTLSSETI